MTPKPEREEALFQAAAQLTGTERAIFLSGACRGDKALRQRIETLLAANEEPGSFMAEARVEIRPTVKLELPDAEDEVVGQTLGRYKLLEKVGEGGCGVVYVAEQTEPVRRRVALKIIKLGMDTKQVVARFEAERQALAMMDHPNIAKVLDAGTTEIGRPYFVMELVRVFIKVCQAIQHAHQKGIIHRDIKPSNILVTLHDGVPVPKVIDFGIAKATEGRLTDATVYTQLHQFIGTPAYMSPEQAEMSGLDIDTRSDIYSLGVLLYELLAGSTPFDAKELMASGIDTMRKTIREKEPVRPSTKLSQTLVAADVRRLKSPSSDTPSSEEEVRASSRQLLRIKETITLLRGDLDWIVMKCLEKDRTRRYETANGLAADLKRHLNNEPVVARPPSQLYRFQKAFRRNKLAFAAAAAVSIALVVGLALAAMGWRKAEAERDGAVKAREEAEVARVGEAVQRAQAQTAQAKEAELRVQAEAQELAARRRAYAADMNLVQQALAANNLQRARYLLDRHRPRSRWGGEAQTSSTGNNQNLLTSAATVDLRGWEWRYLWQSCRGNSLFKLYQQPLRVMFAGFSSDGQHVATSDDTAMVGLWDITTKAEVSRLQDPVVNAAKSNMNLGTACLSDDGEWMAAVGRDETGIGFIKVWNITTRQLMAEFSTGAAQSIKSIALSPDKRKLAAFVHDDAVSLWDIATRQRNGQFAVARDLLRMRGAVRFSPDGAILAIGDADGRVRLVDVKTSTETASFAASIVSGVMSLAFSPDSRVLAAGSAFTDPRIALWDVPAKRRLGSLEGHRGFVAALAFSPDGKILASASGDQMIKLWNTTTWTEETTLMGHVDEVWSVAFSRDSKTLVSSGKDGSVYVWPAHGVRSNHASLGLPEGWRNWDLSPDGESLVAVTSDGGVSAWDVSTGQKKVTPTQLSENNAAAFWSGTGEVVIGAHTPTQIKVWNLARNSVIEYSLNSEGRPAAFWFLPRTRTIITANTNAGPSRWTFKRWDLLAGREISSFTIDEQVRVSNVTFSLDERLLAIPASGGKVIVRNPAPGHEEYSFTAHAEAEAIQGMIIFPNGKLLASASTLAPIVKVWDLATRQEVAALRGHNLVINTIAVSPDGQRLASSTIGQEPMKLWDTTSWEEVANLEVHGAALSGARFLSGGNTLAAYDTSERVHLWRAPSWEEIAAAEAKEKTEAPRP